MKNSLLAVIITLTLGIILTGTVLAPAISDANARMSTVTYSNSVNAVELLDLVDGDEEYTIQFTDGRYTLDGVPIYSCNIYTDHGYFFVSSAGINGQYVNGAIATTQATRVTATDDAHTISLTSNEIVLTDSTDTSTTVAVEWAYITDDEGQWAVVQGDHVYTEEIESLLYIKVFNSRLLAVMEGNTAYYRTYTYSDFLDVTDLPNGGYEVAMPLVITDEWTSERVIAPLSFTVKVTSEYDGLLGAIVPMVVISLVLATVGAVIMSRRD